MPAYVIRQAGYRPNRTMEALRQLEAEAARKDNRAKKPAEPAPEPAVTKAAKPAAKKAAAKKPAKKGAAR